MAFDYAQKMAEIMVLAAQQGASDIHFSVSKHPMVRIDGNLLPLTNEPVLTPEMAAGLIGVLLTPEQQDRLINEKEIDFAFSYEDKIRFRVNVYFQRGYLSAALRLIPTHIRTVEELNLPAVLHEFTKYNQGFFLVVGPAGHGKTTTLAALIDEINHKRMDHIITIEDPVEYLFVQDRALVDQREVGSDTLSFHRALRSVLRQDPDVIMIGEMRDPESISIALTAAETGHLVFSTLHTNSASQTVDRIIDSFPANQQGQIRSQLASTLLGIVSERLAPRIKGGRIPACEVMIVNSAIRNLIREGKTYQLDLIIDTSSQEGMISLNRSLVELVRRREISVEVAENYSLNPSELRQLLG
ncbi:MAG TPA: PilT/PilU family type 4a pilus ATPase [Candidatus Paceibacterota bacterium]|nr:PilT/PilU family type 4a pilus ATPase [Candidatus Paceibacterota bacterium]